METTIETIPNSIEAAVAIEALDYQEDSALSFFRDLLQNGCSSGMIGSLIYYQQTHDFFDDHYSEIEDIRCQIEEDLGQPIQIKGDLKNFFSWLAFEEVARKMIEAMGIEL